MPDKITLLRDRIKTVKAVIFDMDGVLVDSERHHFLAHRKALAEFGVKIEKSFYIDHGISTDPSAFYAKAFHQQRLSDDLFHKIINRKKDIYKRLQQEEGIIPILPAISLVNALHKNKIPLAIGSGVHKDEVRNNLNVLKIDQCFSAIVAGGDFPIRNKPFPDIFLKVAELLKVQPKDCIAIEDSGNGAEAAISAGMNCIVIPNDFTKEHYFACAFVLASFNEVADLFQID